MKTREKSETFSITLTEAQARRLRFIANEDGITVESAIADAAVEYTHGALEGAAIIDPDTREADRALAMKLNTRSFVTAIVDRDLLAKGREIAKARGTTIERMLARSCQRQVDSST